MNLTSKLVIASTFVLSLSWGGVLEAQRIQLGMQRGPYYVGEPVIVQVTADGIESNSEPVCKLASPAPNGLTVQGPQIGRSSNSFVQVINGRVTRSESTNYRFNFVVTANREGEFEVGPFLFELDGEQKRVEGTTLTFEKLISNPEMQIEIEIPQRTLYVGQQVPVTIRWTYSGDRNQLQYLFSNLQIRSPLFDQFTFKDSPPRTRTTLSLTTAKGEVALDAQVSEKKESDQELVVVEAQRIMVADSSGEFSDIAVTCRSKIVTQWGRSLFGDLVARATKPTFSEGEPINLDIKPIPTNNRPDSFSGAIGSGFSIDVAANRSVVRVGDPISLDVTIRGTGNLENVALPSLSAEGGMDEKHFQLPTDQLPGSMSTDAKQFDVSVRVKDESVDQIPALAFSWFDPKQEKFVTTRSKPVALQVMPAQIISTADVVSAASAAPQAVSNRDHASDRPALSFVGANLAIETDVARLLNDSSTSHSNQVIAAGFYALGLLGVVTAWVIRRQRQIDPEIIARNNLQKTWKRQLSSARSLPPSEAAQQVVGTLRPMQSYCTTDQRHELNQLVAACENYIYDQSGSQTTFDSTIIDKALELAHQVS